MALASYSHFTIAPPNKPGIAWMPDTTTSNNRLPMGRGVGGNSDSWKLFARNEQQCSGQFIPDLPLAQSGRCTITLADGN